MIKKTIVLSVTILAMMGCSKKLQTRPIDLSTKTSVSSPKTGVIFPNPREIEKTLKQETLIIKETVLFELDSYILSQDAMAVLNKIIDKLNFYPEIGLNLTGGCCPLGKENYNYSLGEKRGEGVKEYLSRKIKNKLTIKSCGEKELVSDNPQEYFLNRRCEIEIGEKDGNFIR